MNILNAVIKEISAVTPPMIKFIFIFGGSFLGDTLRLKKCIYNANMINVPSPDAKTAATNSGVPNENHQNTENVTLIYTQYGNGNTFRPAINIPPKKRVFFDFLTKFFGTSLRVSFAIKRKDIVKQIKIPNATC